MLQIINVFTDQLEFTIALNCSFPQRLVHSWLINWLFKKRNKIQKEGFASEPMSGTRLPLCASKDFLGLGIRGIPKKDISALRGPEMNFIANKTQVSCQLQLAQSLGERW